MRISKRVADEIVAKWLPILAKKLDIKQPLIYTIKDNTGRSEKLHGHSSAAEAAAHIEIYHDTLHSHSAVISTLIHELLHIKLLSICDLTMDQEEQLVLSIENLLRYYVKKQLVLKRLRTVQASRKD